MQASCIPQCRTAAHHHVTCSKALHPLLQRSGTPPPDTAFRLHAPHIAGCSRLTASCIPPLGSACPRHAQRRTPSCHVPPAPHSHSPDSACRHHEPRSTACGPELKSCTRQPGTSSRPRAPRNMGCSLSLKYRSLQPGTSSRPRVQHRTACFLGQMSCTPPPGTVSHPRGLCSAACCQQLTMCTPLPGIAFHPREQCRTMCYLALTLCTPPPGIACRPHGPHNMAHFPPTPTYTPLLGRPWNLRALSTVSHSPAPSQYSQPQHTALHCPHVSRRMRFPLAPAMRSQLSGSFRFRPVPSRKVSHSSQPPRSPPAEPLALLPRHAQCRRGSWVHT